MDALMIRPGRFVARFAVVGTALVVLSTAASRVRDNPLLTRSTLPFQAPPFDRIRDADYQPALEQGMKEQLAEVERIAENPAAPTFENTLGALERSGQLLARVNMDFNA